MRSLLALVLMTAVAAADGSLPQTVQAMYAAEKPQSLYVVTSHGLIVSHDDGCTFEWVCEQSVGYGGAYIPQFAVDRDGTIYAGTFAGLRISRDGGCNFATQEQLPDLFVEAIAIGPTREIWAVTAESGRTNDVWVSRDHGVTFTAAGLPSTLIRWDSVRVAPGNPERVYVAGAHFSNGPAHLRRRNDDGTWQTMALTGVALNQSARIVVAAIDPTNADIVFVVSDLGPLGDRLYRSTDGGNNFTEVLATEGRFRDVLARDGQTVIATSMVRKGLIFVGGAPSISTDGGATFGPYAGAPTMMCVAEGRDGLLACGANWEPDFMALASEKAGTWTKVWRFTELSGPLMCGAGSGGATICDDKWAGLDSQFMTTGPVCGPNIRPDAGVTIPPPPDDPPEDCCNVSRPTSLIWAFVIGLVVLRRRRR